MQRNNLPDAAHLAPSAGVVPTRSDEAAAKKETNYRILIDIMLALTGTFFANGGPLTLPHTLSLHKVPAAGAPPAAFSATQAPDDEQESMARPDSCEVPLAEDTAVPPTAQPSAETPSQSVPHACCSGVASPANPEASTEVVVVPTP